MPGPNSTIYITQ